MNKNIFLFISYFGISLQANSMEYVPISSNDEASGVGFSHSIKNINNQISNTFISTEPIKFQIDIRIKNEDIGQPGHLYLIATYKDKWFQKLPSGKWTLWNNKESSLLSFSSKSLVEKESLTVLKEELLPEGEYLVYGGYQTNQDSQVFYNSTPATLLVFGENKPGLHQVKNKPLLASYFARGTPAYYGSSADTAEGADFSPSSSTAAAASSSTSASVSQTNLQETGVDEADRIKTDGEHLFALESCGVDLSKQCISSYTIQASPASNTLLKQFDIENNVNAGSAMYLSTFNDKQHLVFHSNSTNMNVFDMWYSSYSWQNTKTNIKLIDVSQPEKMEVETHITIDTSIISSRLIDGVLYLIARKNSYYTYPEDLPNTGNSLLAPNNQTILPTISFNDGSDSVPIVQSTDCYLPSQTSSKPIDNTIITVTAIPLDNPRSHYSTCIAGSVDTFYMSAKALYLATSRYPYSVSGNNIIFSPSDSPDHVEMTTEIHKFALGKGNLDYRGSGTVQGHLGWDTNKQPFRMGEYNDVLKVATSKGDTWGETSTTRVTVLRESSDNALEEISFLDNLGKPGERLFAARFIQNRGYLVTFKKTDPLYVLDFSEPEQPTIVGELEINGYSDYLHPVGDNYLLGIGKDALPNENADQGAFYQGVKLSLFDVSSTENLREVESVIIGKRGTESAVLHDHHALAWLPSKEEGTATLAIPVQLNNVKNDQYSDYNKPNANYGWAHTGLYTLNINTGKNPGIELHGKLITDVPPAECNEPGNYCSFQGQNTQNDRAVIQEDSIHYIHNNAVTSSEIANLK